LKSDVFNTAATWKSKHLDFLFNVPRKDLIRATAVVTAIALLGLIFNTRFGLYVDFDEVRCMPERVYLGYPLSGQLRRGDIVSFRANNRQMFDLMTGKRVAKIVAAVAGDLVESNANGVFVNGKKVALRSSISIENLMKKNKQLVDMNRALEPGEIFVVGTHPRSFDSRYFGAIQASSVDRRVKALF
jgi:conjugal transfer pilin signal peptidase TrbI